MDTTKYYVFDNATRRFKVGGFSFAFEVVEQFGGSWRGVLALSNADEQAALATFADRYGIVEITKDQYDDYLKKKTPLIPSSQTSPVSPPTHKLQDVEVVVRNKNTGPSTADKKKLDTKLVKIDLDDAIVLGEAPYVDPLDERSSKRKSR